MRLVSRKMIDRLYETRFAVRLVGEGVEDLKLAIKIRRGALPFDDARRRPTVADSSRQKQATLFLFRQRVRTFACDGKRTNERSNGAG